MQHYQILDDVHLKDIWLTIGSFDGVHQGHQQIIQELTAGAQKNGVPAVVLTFFPHPAAILRGKNLPYYLTPPQKKAEILQSLAVDVTITHPFNRNVANTSARDFIVNLQQHFNILHIQIGYDFAMGKNRDGDFSALKKIGNDFGFSVQQTPPYKKDGDIVSSSRIRFLLGVGQVKNAAKLLGRNYEVQGIVEMGDQRGRTLGFPTANLSVWAERIIPTAGVYVCRATVRGKTWGAVTNIGVRPTFEATPVPPRVEAHLLDFSEDIYGETVQIEFISRLRAEKKFESIDDLISQIQTDAAEARKLLAA
jgi:riboflavin kinase/FMN adenylyltransferase